VMFSVGDQGKQIAYGVQFIQERREFIIITADDAQNRRAGFVEWIKQFPPIACRSSALGRKTAMDFYRSVRSTSLHSRSTIRTYCLKPEGQGNTSE
jgi:hypothetical protein